MGVRGKKKVTGDFVIHKPSRIGKLSLTNLTFCRVVDACRATVTFWRPSSAAWNPSARLRTPRRCSRPAAPFSSGWWSTAGSARPTPSRSKSPGS
eukprot:scaffold95452_cov40-Prasinocladus_malaysianus.AAC.1